MLAVTIPVNTNLDVIDGSITDGSISIRDAISFAQSGDTISFAPSLSGMAIALNQSQGEILIPGTSLTFDASMLSGGITIDAGGGTNHVVGNGDGIRIFNITDTSSMNVAPPVVTMIGLTLKGGDVSGNGGAIYSEGELKLQGCTAKSNFASSGGGVFVSVGGGGSTARTVLDIEDSTFGGDLTGDANIALFSGGAVDLKTNAPNDAASIANSTVSGNHTNNASGGGVYANLYSGSTLTLNNCVISGNQSADDGGGISAVLRSATNPLSTLTIANSVISGNTASNRGGGIYTLNHYGTSVLIQDTRITDNHVSGSGYFRNGGGVYFLSDILGEPSSLPRLTITGSTVDHNTTAEMGGGVFFCAKVPSEFVATNSTFSTNSTDDTTGGAGGGILIACPLYEPSASVDAYLRNITVTQNVSANGGGIMTKDLDNIRVQVDNSVVSQNFNSSNVSTRVTSNLSGRYDIANTEYNLVGSNALGSNSIILNLSGSPATLDSTNLHSTNLMLNDNTPLGPLQNNGGPTPTHALLVESEAIDAGSNDWASVPLSGGDPDNHMLDAKFMWDQRGDKFARFYDILSVLPNNTVPPPVDIGAYEMQMPKVIDVILNGVDPTTALAWEAGPIHYSDLVALGQQLAPIYRAGTNSIQIAFSEALTTHDVSAFMVLGMPARHSNTPSTISFSFSYDTTNNIATLFFSGGLGADRYRLDVQPIGIIGLGGSLDGEWSDHVDPNNPSSARYDRGTLFDWDGDTTQNLPADLPHYFPSGKGTTGTTFQFKFALEPGDYDQNGIVDWGDYDVWRNSDPRADGDGNGLAGGAGDYNVWRDAIDNYLWLQRFQGDYNQDGAVNGADYALWRSEFSSVYNPAHPELTLADGDDSGLVDMSDYLLWRHWQDTVSPWVITAQGVGAGSLLVDSVSAPEVTNVTISGSTSTHTPYSFATHVGSGAQLTTVPVGGADTISISFSEQVNVEAINLAVVGLTTAHVPTLANFSYDLLTFTATWRFTGLTANDIYAITLADAITDTEGYRLDGEWVNPVSTATTSSLVSHFPSGDGHAGGNFVFLFTLLAGDADLNGLVNRTDLSILTGNYPTASGMLFTQGDFNGDGAADGDDLSLIGPNYGKNLNSAWILADLNGDFRVDDADVNLLVANYGMSSPTRANGDLNGDGHIDDADIDLMFAQYGLELAVVS